MDSTKTVLSNAVNPFLQGGTVAGGLTLDIIVEAGLTYLVRWVLKAHRPFWLLVVELLVSTPLNGLGSWFEQNDPKDQQPLTIDFLTGISNVPQLFLAQYLVSFPNYQYGFHMPSLNIWDVLITVIMRPVSRVIINAAARNNFVGSTFLDAYSNFQTKQKDAAV